jgi:hypothetical protein
MSKYFVSPNIFFVEDANVVADNTHINCVVGTYEDALQTGTENTKQFLSTVNFSINKEEIVENGSIWQAVIDIDKEDEISSFQVFNPSIGVYEPVIGKTNAKQKLEEVKQQYLDLQMWFTVKEIEELPAKVSDKFVSSGTIPVEVM